MNGTAPLYLRLAVVNTHGAISPRLHYPHIGKGMPPLRSGSVLKPAWYDDRALCGMARMASELRRTALLCVPNQYLFTS